MLIEIRSEKLRVGAIPFHEGLNVVLGDRNATNSIGKSTLLMLVDFAFGGNSFIQHNTDVVEELGHHDYWISFSFEGETYRFRRGTFRPDLVYRCDMNYGAIAAMELEEFTSFLKGAYGTARDISFRGLVGLYSRVWGKENLDVHRPLHAAKGQPAAECVLNLIKTFDRYEEIGQLTEKLGDLEKQRVAFGKAFDRKVIPKIGVRQYKQNQEAIAAAQTEIADIKHHLAKYSVNISEIANREVLDAKVQKDRLLGLRLTLESKLKRIRDNLARNRQVSRQSFAALKQFFPRVDENRLERIQEFHNGLAKILKAELTEAEADARVQLAGVSDEIAGMDRRMEAALSAVESPGIIVDRVYELANRFRTASAENDYYDTSRQVQEDVGQTKKLLAQQKTRVLKSIEDLLNDTMRRIVTSVFGEQRKSPELKLTQNSYAYEVFEDTGTGTAYNSLLVFDLAVFRTTSLPILVHDSLLFKNIENDSVARLLDTYRDTDRQSFIAIDEADKYGSETERLLVSKSVVQLDEGNVLYIKNWRRR